MEPNKYISGIETDYGDRFIQCLFEKGKKYSIEIQYADGFFFSKPFQLEFEN